MTPGDRLRFFFADRRFRVPRMWSNRRLAALGPLFEGAVVNVSGWRDEDKEGGRYRDYFPNASEYRVTNTRGDRGLDDGGPGIELDLTEELPAELRRRFDVVFTHTVLEHIFDVATAIHNLCAMSRDVVLLVVPFAQAQHYREGSYGDYWRFTPMALEAAFEREGLELAHAEANRHDNAGIYVLAVGTRRPDHWRARLEGFDPMVETIGQQIGSSVWRDTLDRLNTAVRRVAQKLKPER